MAQRPVFESCDGAPYVKKRNIEFPLVSGFAAIQKMKCSASLRNAYQRMEPHKKVLEISRYSDKPLGVALSAFNLMIEQKNGCRYSVECAFQAGKVFEKGGPYKDLLQKSSIEAKKDPRLKNSGNVIGFQCGGKEFPIKPRTYFYDWLYVNALYLHKEYHNELLEYDAFTDIVFHPQKQFNCQAEAAAIFVALYKKGILKESLSREAFMNVVFEKEEQENTQAVFGRYGE